MLKNIKAKVVNAVIAGGLMAPVLSFASGSGSTGPDFTQITGQVSFASVVTGVMAVSVLTATLYVCIRGAKTVLGFIRG